MENKLLLKIAKDAIESRFNKKAIDREQLEKKHPKLRENGAVFVTLKKDGKLRGCIGSLIPHRSLLDDVIYNAKASAFRDHRFKPLSREELDSITIEISILSPYKKLIYRDRDDLKDKIRPKIDGVILKLGSHQATFLPQVWENLPSFEQFFAYLCQKAGVEPSGCLEQHPTIFIYQVEKVES